MRSKIFAFALAAAFLTLCGCGRVKEPVQTVDPYEGMVQVESGFGTKMWVKLYDDVPVSTFDAADFAKNGGFVDYVGTEFLVWRGIDVSEHQGKIDWEAVAADGIEFAMIRAGYRGYSQGGLYMDEYFPRNIAQARQNGIDVGVYFFSQAVTAEEAVEEAEYLLKLLDEAGGITTTVAFDWEHIGNSDARTDDVDGTTLTDCAVAFCERVKRAGHEPVVYAYRNLAYFIYDLPRLNDYALWMGALGDSPDFYYRHEIWQYSSEGKVKGIDGPVDLNLFFEEKGDGAVPAGGDARSAPEPDEKQQAPSAAPDGENVPAGNAAVAAAATGQETMYTDAVVRVYSGAYVERIETDAPPENGAAVYFVSGGGSYAWPCASSSHITSLFGSRNNTVFDTKAYHSGIDIGADEGAEVTAAAGGTVTEAGYDSMHGNYVLISHSDSEATLYAHMSKLAVSEGESVGQGDVIGYVGSTGNVTGPHLHFEVQVDGECVDPLQYFGELSFTCSADA